MAASRTMEPLEWLRKQLEDGCPDLVREMIRQFAQELMGAEADAICGAPYGERHPERVNHRNGYRERRFDTRAGTIDLEIPRLRAGSYFPDWLLTPRRRAEQALLCAIADAYLAGVSTRRVDKLVRQLGIDGISKSQVSVIASRLDEVVAAFRSRPLEGPYPYLWLDALEVKCRDDHAHVTPVACLIGVAVNPDGRREVLGIDITTTEDGAGWLSFLRGLVARGLAGVKLVISDVHTLRPSPRTLMRGVPAESLPSARQALHRV